MDNLHSNSVVTAGAALTEAAGALIMLHGRGDSARGILGLASELALPGLAFAAPEARSNAWYPHSFLEPLERNEPWLSSALQVVADVISRIEEAGIPLKRIALLGFSQGACLATEFTARNPERYGGVFGLSGGLIGPPGKSFIYPGSLSGTPVFLGCSDVDPFIPVERVHETARVLLALDAAVEERIYPGFGHNVNEDELTHVRSVLEGMLSS